VDEITAVGDARFRRKSEAMFRDRLARSGAIYVAHSMSAVRALCNRGAVLEAGQLTWYDDVDEAIAHHERNMAHA
jgi:capsular polysaccharide transport system ATP-binding protein